MNDIKFISVESNIHGKHETKLLHSCRLNDVDLEIIGKGTEWKGNITKYEIVIDYLNSIDNELVCLTDSRDVLYMNNPTDIYNTFIDKFDKDSIVFNGETNCWPDESFAERHPFPNKKYRYLNSGCVIGSRELLLSVYMDACKLCKESEEDITSDQYYLQQIFMDGQYGDNFTLDYNCDIFQCVWDEHYGRSNNFDLIYTREGIYNRLTDTIPLIFHFPGPTTTDSQVWKILNGEYYKIVNKRFFE